MYRLLLTFALILTTSIAMACPCTGDDSPCECPPTCECQAKAETVQGKADPAYGVVYTEGRIQLPQDQGKWYLTLMGDKSDEQFATVSDWFNQNPQLRKLKSQTHFNMLPADSAMFQDRYRENTATLPCIRLQTAEGVVVFQASGDNLPLTAEALTKGLSERIFNFRRRCPDGNCRPHREPTPEPKPVPDTDEDPIDHTGPPDTLDEEPVDSETPWYAFAGVFAAGAALGARRKMKEIYEHST